MIGKAVLGTDIEFYVKFICLSCLGLFCVWLLYLYTLLVTSARFVTQIYTAKPKFLCFFFRFVFHRVRHRYIRKISTLCWSAKKNSEVFVCQSTGNFFFLRSSALK